MQQKRMSDNNQCGLVTPAEYARRRGLNRSTVCRQIAQGKIPSHGGLVNPEEADRARRENLDQCRGRRKKVATPAATRREWADGEEACYVAWKVCKSARESFAEMFGDSYPKEEEPDTSGRLLRFRVYSTVIVSFLLEAWLEDLLKIGPELPPIAWGHFGDKASEARELGEICWKQLSGGDE